MVIENGKIVLEKVSTISPFDSDYMAFTDVKSNKFFIPVETVIRLHSILQFDVERSGMNFEEYCRTILENN